MNKKKIEKYLDSFEVIILLLILLFIPILTDSSLFLSFELIKIIVFRVLTLLLFLVVFINRLNFGQLQHKYVLKYFARNKFFSVVMLLFLLNLLVVSILSQNTYTSIWGNYDKRLGLYTLIHLAVLIHLVIEIYGKNRKLLFNILPIFILVPLVINLSESIEQVSGKIDLAVDSGRVIGTFGQSNFLAGFALLLLPFQLYYFFETKKFDVRILHFFGIVFSFVLIWLSGSRLAVILFPFCIFIYIAFLVITSKKKLIVKLVFSMFITISLVISTTFLYFYSDRIREIGIYDNSRIEIWKASVDSIQHSPLIGYGFDVSGYVLPTSMYIGGRGDPIALDRAHNEILDIVLNIGLIGLVLQFTLISYTYIRFIILIANQTQFKRRLFLFSTLLVSFLFWVRSLVNLNSIVQYLWVAFAWGIIVFEVSKYSKVSTTNNEFINFFRFVKQKYDNSLASLPLVFKANLKFLSISIIFIIIILNIILNFRFYLADKYYNNYQFTREVESIQKAFDYNPTQIRYSLELLQAKLLSKENFNLDDVVPIYFRKQEVYWGEYFYRIGKYYEFFGNNGEAIKYYGKAIEVEPVKENYIQEYERLINM